MKKPDWRNAPQLAFAQFVSSEAYLKAGRRAPATNPQTGAIYPLRDNSKRVLSAMFNAVCAYLIERGLTFDTVNSAHIGEFLNRRTPGRRGPYSRVRVKYLALLERVFAHLEVNPNPAGHASLEAFRTPGATGRNLERQALTAAQVAAFLANLPGQTPTDDWRAQRDGALLALILGAGLLPSEAVTLHTTSVALKPGQTRVSVKVKRAATGNRADDHEALLQPVVVDIVLGWVQRRRELATYLPGKFLFPASPGRGVSTMSVSAVYRATAAVFERAQIPVKRLGPRTLRNTYIETELGNGTPPEVVQQYVGLAELKSIEAYLDGGKAKRRPAKRGMAAGQ
ncbi:site-specific integrase [Oxalobacteraceae bacterium OM1]|nr:site-specific integrase [Oxalobacteraceae bacterium OM1]